MTLLEVVLAIAIILLLLAGMFGFYEHAMNGRSRTQAAAAESQLARAILSRMSEDLSNVSALTGILRTRATMRGFAVAGSSSGVTPEGGLVGTADSLRCQSARYIPIGRFAEVALLGQAGLSARGDSSAGAASRPPMYDVQEIHWYWSHDPQTGAGSGVYRAARPAVLAPTNAAESADAPDGGPADGEVEGEGGEGPAGPAGAPDPLLLTELVSPEVRWLHLRYYDGAVWSEQYEGGLSGPNPLAVEITIGFAPLLSEQEAASGKTLAERLAELFGENASQPLPPRSYQLAVYLPSGEFAGGGGLRMQRRR